MERLIKKIIKERGIEGLKYIVQKLGEPEQPNPYDTLTTSVTGNIVDLPDGLNLEDLDRIHVVLLCEILSEEG